MFGNLLKAAVGIAVAPVALAVDIVTLPISASDPDPRVGPFDRTSKVLDSVGKNVNDALD